MEAINLQDKFKLFDDQWSPKKIAALNGQLVKLAKLSGEFLWHSHEKEDELFMVIQGTLFLEFHDKIIEVNAGELIVVPRGVEHRPYTREGEETWVMLFEPEETQHTGQVESERTQNKQPWI